MPVEDIEAVLLAGSHAGQARCGE